MNNEFTPHQGDGKREFVRTDDTLPVYYEPIIEGYPPHGAPEWEVMFDELEPKPEENPKLYELLFDIHQKLNILINYMNEKTGFSIPEAREVNISGGGIRFNCRERFDAGEKILIKTFLPVYAHVIKVKCEVVRSIPRIDGGYEIALKFIDLEEATREKIIKYIFAKQREILRTGKSSDKKED